MPAGNPGTSKRGPTSARRSFRTQRRPKLRKLRVGELIRVSKWAPASSPVEFRWRGRRHQVRRLRGFRCEPREVSRSGTARRLYHLETVEGLNCWIAEDTASRTCWLEDILI